MPSRIELRNGLGHGLIYIDEHLRKELSAVNPETAGAMTSILGDLSRVAKRVSYLVNTAGLTDALGKTGRRNIHKEEVIILDDMSNGEFKDVLLHNENVAGYASEEEPDFVAFPQDERGKYVVWFDPLDGSSNFDTNISIGSIFGIYRRLSSEKGLVEEADFLQKGSEQVCAGYFLYGTSTMFVYTVGNGVHALTLDPTVGEFALRDGSSKIEIPQVGKTYSINEAYSNRWTPQVAEYIDYLKTREEDPCSSRYVGSLVADFHRNLLKGGVYLYPGPNAKLRINCELNPLSLIVEQAGGMASDGASRILDITPSALHQRSPVAIGSTQEVRLFEKYLGNNSTVQA